MRAAHLAELQRLVVARERRARGVVPQGIGPLVVVRRVALRERDRRIASRDAAQVERSRDLVAPAGEAVTKIHAADVGAVAQVLRRERVVVAVHGGDDRANAALAAAQVLAQPHHAVVGGRLDGRVAHARDVLSHGVERADGHPAGQAPGELGRAEDPGEGGRGGVLVRARQLGRAPDAAGVDQTLSRAAVVHRRAVHVVAKDPRPLHKERSLLLEKGLERREVEDARIGLNLAEVGIDRGVEGQVRRDPVLQVAAQGHVLRTTDARRGELRHVLRHHVGGGLEPAWGLEVVEPVDVAELRYEPCLGLP